MFRTSKGWEKKSSDKLPWHSDMTYLLFIISQWSAPFWQGWQLCRKREEVRTEEWLTANVPLKQATHPNCWKSHYHGYTHCFLEMQIRCSSHRKDKNVMTKLSCAAWIKCSQNESVCHLFIWYLGDNPKSKNEKNVISLFAHECDFMLGLKIENFKNEPRAEIHFNI